MSVNLRKLAFSPKVNPLIDTPYIKTKKRQVRSLRKPDNTWHDPKTGELRAISTTHIIEEKDDIEFVKVFAAGITAAYDLTKTSQRVFQIILNQYQQTPMTGGYTDSVDLYWFGNGIEGEDAGMSEKTFQRGLKELLAKQFIAPKTPTSYWVNPALFFKGDRVLFIKEYIRVKRLTSNITNTLSDESN